MKKYIITILYFMFSSIAFSVYSMEENTDILKNATNNRIFNIENTSYFNWKYIDRFEQLLKNLDQWLFVYSPEKNKYILNLLPVENLIYDVVGIGKEIKSIQDYVQKIEFQDKEEKEQLSYTMPTKYCPIISLNEELKMCNNPHRNIILKKYNDENLLAKPEEVLKNSIHFEYLEAAIEFFMTKGFEAKNEFYKTTIHDAFQFFPIKTVETIMDLAQSAKLPIEKRRALSIIKTYDNDLLQKVIDLCPDIVKTVARDEKLFKLLLDNEVKFNQEQLKSIFGTNNLASISVILSQQIFSLNEGPIKWFYDDNSCPETFDFNSMIKVEEISETEYTKQMIINSLPEQYNYAKKVCILLLEARNTGDIKMLERLISQNKPSQKIFALKESNEISNQIAQEDMEIFDKINRICLGSNTLYSYPANFTEKVSEFVAKYSELLQKNQNFLDCLLEKTKDLNKEENQRMRIKVNSQPTVCWPSIGIGPSAYLLYRSSCEGNFNPWAAFLGAGILAWSGWKTYAYYNDYQRLTRAINLQEKTNKLEGYLTSLESRKKLNKKNLDKQNNKENTDVRQWPNIDSKIGQPLGLGGFAIPLIFSAMPLVFKTVFKKDTHVEVANDKPEFDFWNNITSGLSFSALSAWLWRQNKNKFGSDDAQNLFISCRNRGEADGFAKMQKLKKHELLQITSQNET